MTSNYQKLVFKGALLALSGFIFSGPVGFLAIKLSKPQKWIEENEYSDKWEFDYQ